MRGGVARAWDGDGLCPAPIAALWGPPLVRLRPRRGGLWEGEMALGWWKVASTVAILRQG